MIIQKGLIANTNEPTWGIFEVTETDKPHLLLTLHGAWNNNVMIDRVFEDILEKFNNNSVENKE